ncbi:putative cytochrome c oxidase subunit IV [Lyophyllum shimeji]|uniref:Cytochrome c oxidase subunit IV n=1 Tax=Lyophyllum shimeji TaxID=47721 RepID=A0A9P3PEQ8_LYOSH|nr:putative cytochrome c oxidase subunit IV [Lyophyllum shimeji]
MQAAARSLARVRAVRCLTTTASPSHVAGSTAAPASSSSSKVAPIPLSNVEAQWAKLSPEEKQSVHEQLEEIQKRDWKTLSLDEKRAAYYVAFGPHGPRTPTSLPGDGYKIFFWTMTLVAAAGGIYYGLRQLTPPPPKTLTKEWEEAMNERAKEMKINPISGISSEGYTGKGFIQSPK